LDGNPDSAACNDCHNLHEIHPLGAATSHENREFHTKVCLKCHANDEMMERNGVTNIAVKTYLDSYHGKNYRLGFPEKAAGCADCHTSHAILPPQDIKSSINPANLVQTCGKCHPQATVPFTEYYPHAEMTNSEEYPVLYWTFILMTGLLLGTFTVFWIHTLLWLFRGFVENREKLAELHNGHIPHAVPDGHKQYRRFKMRHIIMHLSVIISFLGLSLTGLPLKFADQGWAHFIASDGHSADWRNPDMRDGLAAAAAELSLSVEDILWTVEEGPAQVLAGEQIRPPRLVASAH
jgi:hypothetical protein